MAAVRRSPGDPSGPRDRWSRPRSWRWSEWRAPGCTLHGHVHPVVGLGHEPGALPEPAGVAVLQDVASDAEAVGVGLIQQAPDQAAADTDAAELRGEGDVHDDDRVIGAVDDEPSGLVAAHADDRIVSVGEGFPVMTGLGVELHTDEGILFLFGPAEPG